MCGTEVSGGYPRFYLPVLNRFKKTTPSKRVCPQCFMGYIHDHPPDGVTVQNIPEPDRDEFYGGEEP